MDTFSLSNGNPAGVRDEIVNNLSVHQQSVYVATHQWIPFLAYLKGDIPKQLNKITAAVSQAETANAEFGGFLSGRRSEMEAILKATREAASEAGVGVFTDDFVNDAQHRDLEATSWLARSTWFAVLTLIAAFGLFFVEPARNQYSLIQFATSKVVVLGMLIAITAWCASNFKANKHQATVSRHKAHALKTFQAFVQATDNAAIKDAVLIETTRAIFAHNQTGYLNGDSPNEGPSRVFEIFKGGGDGKAS